MEEKKEHVREFEDWYKEIVERGFFDKYTIKDIIKMAWVVGADPFSNTNNVNPYYEECDEDMILSYEFFDPDYEKNHPEMFKSLPPLEERIPKEELDELKRLIEEKKINAKTV